MRRGFSALSHPEQAREGSTVQVARAIVNAGVAFHVRVRCKLAELGRRARERDAGGSFAEGCAGGHHRRLAGMDGVDDLAWVNPL